jgi:hypothetical protein
MPVQFASTDLTEKTMRLIFVAVFGLLYAIAGGVTVTASAREKKPAAATQAPMPGIDAQALTILKSMSDTLAEAKSLSFSVRRAFDEPARNNQPIFYMVGSDVTLTRPDKLKIVTSGDGPPSEVFYDGRELTVFMPRDNLAAVMTAPNNIEDMLEAAFAKAGFYLPFVDFIVADPYKAITENLVSAFVVGKSNQVGSTATDIVAIANPDFQAQIWIGTDDKLPRLVWINPVSTNDKPRSMIEFSNWKLDQAPPATAFTSDAAKKAGRMEFASPSGPIEKKK